ncbi:hypothetical protein ACHAW6_004101 [Cyclotella cf. meneghiniana]
MPLLSGNAQTNEQSDSHFDKRFKLERKLMSGSYGTVYAGVRISDGTKYAIKIVDRSKLSSRDDDAQTNEVKILRFLANEQVAEAGGEQSLDIGIIRLIDFFKSPLSYHIVMELAEGGDVFERLAKRKVYTEKDARDLARRMLQSIQFMHERGIAHRDIKPENLLIMSEHDDTDMKLADFGFARRFSLNDPDKMTTKCGTPAFVPPELVSSIPYGPKCDIWSAGCTLFMLLSGRAPFSIDKSKGGKNAMFYKIRAGDYVFYNSYWKHVSLKARRLVLSMMQVDPKRRVSAAEALRSEWITADDDDLRRLSLEPSLREIIGFNARRKLKGAVGAVMVAAGAKFWDISSAAIWRENLFDSDKAVDGECEREEENSPHSHEALNSDASPYPSNPPTFESLYQLDTKLEARRNVTIWQGKSFETEKAYTIKIVDRLELSLGEEGAVLNEVAILKSLRHRHIVNLLDFFEDPMHFYLVTQKCSGGDVLDRVSSLNHYSEKDARELSRGLLSAVEFMHQRYEKTCNRLYCQRSSQRDSDNTSIKISDFGIAKRVHMPHSLTTLCGSLHYVAPEVLKNHRYIKLTPSPNSPSSNAALHTPSHQIKPFYNKSQQALFNIIRLGEYEFDPSDWADVSQEAMNLIKKLLVVDPMNRNTATEALQSDWIKDLDDEVLAHCDLDKKRSIMNTSLREVVNAINWRGYSGVSDISFGEGRASF